MAEAAVDKQSNSQLLKYFCHQCSDSVEITAASDATNLTCPKCESSFIEEMTQELENDHLQADARHERDPLSFLRSSNPTGLLSSMLLSLNSMNQDEDDDDDDDDDLLNFMHQRPASLSSTTSPSQSTSVAGRGGQLSPFHRFLETLLGNLRAGSGSVDHSAGFLTGFSPYLQGFHGDPRDYAWGADGIDNIITDLLNQTEGAGPPPATKEDIDTLPSTAITQDFVDRAAQCPVCLENFLLDETVRCLPCEHVFHSNCVVPWLQLNRTCPICRTPVGGEASDYVAPPPPHPLSSETIEAGPVNNSLVGHEPRRLSNSSSSSSTFHDAIEEPGQHDTNLRASTFMETNFPDDLESLSDMEV